MIEKGISFGNIHSFHDLNLILSKVEIPPAKAKTTYVDIPGGNGSVDLTEANGEVKFYDRECKFTFTMNPKYDLSDEAFEEKKTEVSNLLNGRTFKITLDKDSDFYYEGRCTVEEFLSDRRIRQIVVSAKVKPYKFKQNKTVLKYNLTAEQKTVNITNSRKTVSPTFECTNDDTMIVFGNASFSLSAGTHKVLDIQLKEGNNQLKVSGSGTLTISYQEGDL
jgi:phage-related protein